jgi:hypothetical protein
MPYCLKSSCPKGLTVLWPGRFKALRLHRIKGLRQYVNKASKLLGDGAFKQ